MTNNITLTTDGDIAIVALDNPGKLNAMTLAAWDTLGTVMEGLAADDAVRCVVVRGAGDAFCAGADIAEFKVARADAEQARNYGAVVARALGAVVLCRHPTVAAIRGPCTGGGLEIAGACDIRIAARDARFGVPVNRLGFSFAYPEIAALLNAAGPTLVLELLLEGRILDAAEAERRGLVNRVVADDFDAEVAATARRIADGAPLANQATKAQLRRLLEGRHITDQELADSYGLCDSEDYKEGVRAFLAKEKPKFEGR